MAQFFGPDPSFYRPPTPARRYIPSLVSTAVDPYVIPFIKQPTDRWLPPARRGRFFFAPFTGLSLEQAVVPDFNGRPTNRSPLPTRRGRFFFAPFTGLSLEKAVVPEFFARSANRLPLPTRRGRFNAFAPFTALSLEQAVVPDFNGRPTNRSPLPTRRGKGWGPPIVGLAPGQFVVPDRITARWVQRRIPPARRGQFLDFVLVGRAPGQVDAPDRIKSLHPRTLPPARRGQFQARIDVTVIIPPGSQAKPPSWIIPALRNRVFTLARRGRFAFAPFNGRSLEQAVVPDFATSRRVPIPRVAHGRFQSVPVVDQTVVTFRSRRRASGARVLQREAFQPVSLGAPQVPPGLIEPSNRGRLGKSRRGTFQRFVPTAAAAATTNGNFFNFFG